MLTPAEHHSPIDGRRNLKNKKWNLKFLSSGNSNCLDMVWIETPYCDTFIKFVSTVKKISRVSKTLSQWLRDHP
jgi:hypothetical protein